MAGEAVVRTTYRRRQVGQWQMRWRARTGEQTGRTEAGKNHRQGETGWTVAGDAVDRQKKQVGTWQARYPR